MGPVFSCCVLLFEPVFPLREVGELAGVAAAVEAENGGGDAVEQIAVVRDEHERAGEVEQVLFEDFERGDVEVVGGLVEQQNVGGLEHELGDEHARPFAAGEIADRLVELLAGKEEARGPTGDVNGAALVDDAVAFRGEGAAQGQVLVELAHLAEVDQAQGFGALRWFRRRARFRRAAGAGGWFCRCRWGRRGRLSCRR